MNVHPLIVHFPIALLTVYAISECIRFQKINSHPSWFYIKAFLVIVGALSSYAAIFAGGIASLAYADTESLQKLINTHKAMAITTSVIFSILAVKYVWQIFKGQSTSRAWRIGSVVLALLGLCSVTITAALGVSLARGPSFDPVVQFVYGLFIE